MKAIQITTTTYLGDDGVEYKTFEAAKTADAAYLLYNLGYDLTGTLSAFLTDVMLDERVTLLLKDGRSNPQKGLI